MLLLAFDLATRTGWALGKPGARKPRFGGIRFASRGASHEALFAGALTFFADFIGREQPNRIVYEAPLLGSRRRHSYMGNDEIGYGLPAIMQAVAHLRGIYDIRTASTSDVRHHFIGHNPKRDIAKKATIRRCQDLGWDVGNDDNIADACAIWLYACSFVKPSEALRPTPLFSGHAAHAEELS